MVCVTCHIAVRYTNTRSRSRLQTVIEHARGICGMRRVCQIFWHKWQMDGPWPWTDMWHGLSWSIRWNSAECHPPLLLPSAPVSLFVSLLRFCASRACPRGRRGPRRRRVRVLLSLASYRYRLRLTADCRHGIGQKASSHELHHGSRRNTTVLRAAAAATIIVKRPHQSRTRFGCDSSRGLSASATSCAHNALLASRFARKGRIVGMLCKAPRGSGGGRSVQHVGVEKHHGSPGRKPTSAATQKALVAMN